MRTIWKYAIPPIIDREGVFAVTMPEGSGFLALQHQPAAHGPQMWFEVSPDLPPVRRRFVVVPTGGEVPGAVRQYLGTFQVDAGLGVYHVFELLSGGETTE